MITKNQDEMFTDPKMCMIGYLANLKLSVGANVSVSLC